MVGLFQVWVLVLVALRIRVWRGVGRVVRLIWASPLQRRVVFTNTTQQYQQQTTSPTKHQPENNKMSPLQNLNKTPLHNTKPQLNNHHHHQNPHQPTKLGADEGRAVALNNAQSTG